MVTALCVLPPHICYIDSTQPFRLIRVHTEPDEFDPRWRRKNYKNMKALKQFWYGQVIERITGRIFSGDYDYQGKPFFSDDTFKTQGYYNGVWSDFGKIEVVEKWCYGEGIQHTQLYFDKKISFYWSTTIYHRDVRHVKL